LRNYVIIYLIAIFVSSVSQILLKISANHEYDSKIQEYLNWKVLLAYSMFFCSSLITILAYKAVPLSLGPILESVGYVFVAGLSYVFLKERLGKIKIFGLMLIIFGVVIAGL